MVNRLTAQCSIVIVRSLTCFYVSFHQSVKRPFRPPCPPAITECASGCVLVLSSSGVFDCTKRHVTLTYVDSGLFSHRFPTLTRQCGSTKIFNPALVTSVLCVVASKYATSARCTCTRVLHLSARNGVGFIRSAHRCTHHTRHVGGVFASGNFRVMCSCSTARIIKSNFFFAVNCKGVAKNRLLQRLLCCKMDDVSLSAANDRRRNIHTYASQVHSRLCPIVRRHVETFRRSR